MFGKIILLLLVNLCTQVSFAQVNQIQKEGIIEDGMIKKKKYTDTKPDSLQKNSIKRKGRTEIESVCPLSGIISKETIKTEMIINYLSEDKNWVWDNTSWLYKNMKVGAYPPDYQKQTIMKKHISKFHKEKNIYTLNEENDETIEYYRIVDGWTWNEDLRKWVYEDETINISPNYKLLKTVSYSW